MKKVIGYGSALIAAGVLAAIYKDEIKCAARGLRKFAGKSMNKCCNDKPTIVMLYDSECHCDDSRCNDNESAPEGDECVLECCEDKCECNINKYKDLFSVYRRKADTAYIDISRICPSEYIERFGIECVPAVLVMSKENNLIAMIEEPESICDVEYMLENALRCN